MSYTPVVLSPTDLNKPIDLPRGEVVLILDRPQKQELIFPTISIEGGRYEAKLILSNNGKPEQVILTPMKPGNGKSGE